MTALSRDKNHPWKLKTAPGTSDYTEHLEEANGTQVLV